MLVKFLWKSWVVKLKASIKKKNFIGNKRKFVKNLSKIKLEMCFARIFQSNVGQFQLNNYLNLSGAVNYSASANEKIGKPSLNLNVKPEVYGYMFFGSKTSVPSAGDMSFESTTSIKIGPLKIETTNSSTGNFEFKLGMTNKFGFEFKSAPAKEKVVLTSNSGTISY